MVVLQWGDALQRPALTRKLPVVQEFFFGSGPECARMIGPALNRGPILALAWPGRLGPLGFL